MPYLSFAAICLFFGSNFYLMSLADDAFGPIGIAAGRVTGALVVLAVAWWGLARGYSIPRRYWTRIIAAGLVANGWPYVVQPWLIRQFGHSFFGMLVAFTPLLTILVSIPMLGLWPTRRQLVGVLAGLGFMALLVYDGEARGIPIVLVLLAITVPLSYAVSNVYMRRSLSHLPSTPLTAAILIPSTVLLPPVAMLRGPLTDLGIGPPAEPQNLATAAAALVALGVFGTGATMWLFVRLLQQQGPLFAGMVTYVVPVIALLWGRFDGEAITRTQLIAIAGLLASVALVQYGATANDSSQAKRPEPAEDSENVASESSKRAADVATVAGEV